MLDFPKSKSSQQAPADEATLANQVHPLPKLCYTAAGILVHQKKVLLIKHKKLQMWLAPGGHMEPDEYPHQAAEREFYEETGVRVKAIDPPAGMVAGAPHPIQLDHYPSDQHCARVPAPFMCNVHWVCEDNYHARLQSSDPEKRQSTKMWSRGCEQHFGFLFLLEATGDLAYTQNKQETDGIGWFSLEQLADLETAKQVRFELSWALKQIT